MMNRQAIAEMFALPIRKGWKPSASSLLGIITNAPEWRDQYVVYGMMYRGRIFYVGRSSNAATRYNSYNSPRVPRLVDGWISSVGWENVKMVALVRETRLSKNDPMHDEQAKRFSDMEADMILLHRDRMFNEYLGRCPLTKEAKERQSVSQREAQNRPHVVAKRKASISDTWKDDDVRERKIASITAAHARPETKALHRRRVREAMDNPETSAKIREAKHEYWDGQREKMLMGEIPMSRRVRVEVGLCHKCPNTPLEGKNLCASCNDKENERCRKKYAKRMAARRAA